MSENLKIGLIGYGKMGRMIENLAASHAADIRVYFDSTNLFKINKDVESKIRDVKVLLDFSVSEAVYDNIKTAAHYNKKLVIGTTAWYDNIDEIRRFVIEKASGVIYGSNFSVGVNLLFKVVEYAAGLFSAFPEYDVFIEESHHKEKKDAPSGTAISLQQLVQKSYHKQNVTINSLRAGYIPGTHAIKFDSAADSVSLEHMARSRLGFSEGALMAARWIVDKTGFYEFREVLEDIVNKKEKFN